MPSILIVDDSRTAQMLVRTMLQGIRGASFLTAGNGREALDVLSRNVVDLMVTDVNMPEMDGIELVREVRKTRDRKSLPILIMTALGETLARDEGLALGADAYLLKPIGRHELIAHADGLLKAAQGGAVSAAS
jgi:CheY-like chemotaxis protein